MPRVLRAGRKYVEDKILFNKAKMGPAQHLPVIPRVFGEWNARSRANASEQPEILREKLFEFLDSVHARWKAGEPMTEEHIKNFNANIDRIKKGYEEERKNPTKKFETF
jgi:hypothetical protein